MRIGTRNIGPGSQVFIVAEMSCNHNGSLDLALRLIDAAKAAGADAVKFQLYTPDEMTCRSDHPAYRLTDGPWAGRTLWDLYSEARTPLTWLPRLAAHAEQAGILWFASVFGPESLAVAEACGCPAYKVASAEVTHLDLVRAMAATGKPVLISNGMVRSISPLVGTCLRVDTDWLELLCVSDYPAHPEDYALGVSKPNPWGVSDHTTTNTVAVAAVALGACVVEKHLMLTSGAYMVGNGLPLDADHSIEPDEFRHYVAAIRASEAMLRNTELKLRGSQWRRRLVYARDLPAGHVLTEDDVVVKRCGEGLVPELDGMKSPWPLRHDVRMGDPVMP